MKGVKVVDMMMMSLLISDLCSSSVINFCTRRNCHFRLLLGRFFGQNCSKWALSEKIQTGVGLEDIEFPGVLYKEHVEIQGVN